MQELYTLIQSLTSGEWASLQNYFTFFTAHDAGKLKYLQLARLLMDSKECPEEKYCCLKIYGVKSDRNFDTLKSRLKDKVLDFLLTDISADKQKELDEVDYMAIKIKKKSAQFQQLYYSKTRIPLLLNLLDEIINLAKKYEYYVSVVEHLRLKKTLVSFKGGTKEFNEVNEDMEKHLLCYTLANKAEHFYYELIMLSEYSGKRDKQKVLEFLTKAISEVSEGHLLTKSPIINYYLKILEMDFCQLNEDYLKSRSTCLELLEVVRNNKSVYRRQRISVVYVNLSRCEYYLGRYEPAAEYAREAQKNFNLSSENYCIALEQEFYALFAMKEYDRATEIASKMLVSAPKKELGAFRFSKYNFLLANGFFKQGKFHDVLHILSGEREIAKDKAGWEVGARVLSIMSLIETHRQDEASSAVLNLKQFFKYNDKKGTAIGARDKKILNLLLIAERNGFMFNLLNGSTDKYMSLLSSGDPNDKEYQWEPFTHEVIPFHEWFAGKMGKHIAPVTAVPSTHPTLVTPDTTAALPSEREKKRKALKEKVKVAVPSTPLRGTSKR